MLEHRERKTLWRKKYVRERKRRFEKTATTSLIHPLTNTAVVLTPAQLIYFLYAA